MSTIKYPNGISTINTMQSKSYSSRGMRLENDINDSNGSLTLAHSQNSQMSFMYGFFFVKFLFYTVVCVVIVI